MSVARQFSQPCVVAGWRVERYVDSVPAIDCYNRQGELNQFGLTELATCDIVDRIWNLVFKPGHGLGPCQRSALAIAVKMRRLAPHADHVEALLGLPAGAQVLGMHVETICAAIELGQARVDKVDQLRRTTRLLDRLAQGQHGL